MNYMKDLREEVAERLRRTLDGKEVDMLKEDVLVEHMLGVTPIGETVEMDDTNDTILDKEHDFWQSWHEDIHTGYDIRKKINSSIKSLSEEGILNIIYPYGEDADIAFVEVDWPEENDTKIRTACIRCGELNTSSLSMNAVGNSYNMTVCFECDNCGKSGVYETTMTKR